ncbi:DUF4253 domain-containing protein [Yinghuangia sp. YIM S09857]|uniref:DUF4253 domain-containing protein n=1 Tax=Yinghuangia sp. YIM S09857 TaxID=3436929 RepID=UPI003F53D5DF
MTMHRDPLAVLANDPTGRSLGLDLPRGTVVHQTSEGPRPAFLWHTGTAVGAGIWTRLEAAAQATGLQPVVFWGDWRHDLDHRHASDPGDHDPDEVLNRLWDACMSDVDDPADVVRANDKTIAPFGTTWPGPAPASTAAPADGAAAELVEDLVGSKWFTEPRGGLVDARRSADILTTIGWTGSLNHDNDVAVFASVLRSWEERFGARLVALSFDRLEVAVSAPPCSANEALAVAAEHYAFCPDNVWQATRRTRTIGHYAATLVNAQRWSFWWD